LQNDGRGIHERAEEREVGVFVELALDIGNVVKVEVEISVSRKQFAGNQRSQQNNQGKNGFHFFLPRLFYYGKDFLSTKQRGSGTQVMSLMRLPRRER
jgi:hypothetical protein